MYDKLVIECQGTYLSSSGNFFGQTPGPDGLVRSEGSGRMGFNPGGSWIGVMPDTVSLFLSGMETPPERRFVKKYRETDHARQPGTGTFAGVHRLPEFTVSPGPEAGLVALHSS